MYHNNKSDCDFVFEPIKEIGLPLYLAMCLKGGDS